MLISCHVLLQVLYTGSGSVFGVTSKDVPKGEWRALDLPDKNVKVEYCACDSSGCFSLVVSDKGMVYFGGLNKKGEAGEAGRGCGFRERERRGGGSWGGRWEVWHQREGEKGAPQARNQ